MYRIIKEVSKKLPTIHEHLSIKREEFYNNDINVKPNYLERILLLRIYKRQETDILKLYEIKKK